MKLQRHKRSNPCGSPLSPRGTSSGALWLMGLCALSLVILEQWGENRGSFLRPPPALAASHGSQGSLSQPESLGAWHLERDSLNTTQPAKFNSPEFAVPKSLEKRVEFWKLIFTKYEKHHAVLHHRLHPHIVYSVLDFSDYEDRYKGKTLKNKKQKAVDEERARIKKTLKRLERGKVSGAQEERLFTLFQDLPGALNSNLKKAQKTKLIRWQSGIKAHFREGLVRSGRYLYAIESIFRDQNLPLELSRLPLVESSFNYEAKSSVGAAGIWQFMPSTGRLYMAVDRGLDERRDPIMATRGAARYLKNAYDSLGRWPIALTSYNHGVGGMKRAVKQTGSKDLAVIIEKYKSKTFGFASSNFYVSFLAALHVEQNAKKYFPDLVREKPLLFDEISLGKSISFSKLKSLSGISEDEILKLNKAFLKAVRNGSRHIPAGYLFKVPKGEGVRVAKALSGAKVVNLATGTDLAKAKKKSARRSVGLVRTTHRVKPGQTLGSIARRYGTSTKALMRLNGIKNPRRLRAGQRLKIPGKSGGSSRAVSKKSSGSGKKFYRVRKGDTLYGIARRNGTNVSAVRGLNPGVRNKIIPGQKLRIR